MMSVVAFVLAFALIFCSPAMACNYTCPTGTYNITTNNIINYGVMNYYSNSGSGDQVVYDYDYDCDNYVEYDDVYYEQIDTDSYCLLCGLTWDLCTCYDEDYDEGEIVYPTQYGGDCDHVYYYNEYSYGNCDCYDDYESDYYTYEYNDSICTESVYAECSTQMCHWANLRDECGNIIGVVDAGANVEICGPCADNPSRTIIYDYTTGCYGTVASCYLYGASDYYYENPAEWNGNVGGSVASCVQSCDYVYGPSDTWACDNYEWLQNNDCGTTEYFDCDESYEDWDGDCEEDCEDVMVFYCNGRIANQNVSINIDLSNSVINVYSGNKIILSGDCDCTGLECGEYSYCTEYEAYCGGYGASLPNGCPMSVSK